MDTCPSLRRVELPSNNREVDGTIAPKYMWIPKAPGDYPNCLQQDATLDIGWFKKQMEFLLGLSKEEREILRSYTRNGDEVINIIIRGNPDKKTQEKLMRIVNKLKSRTDRYDSDKIDDMGNRVRLEQILHVTERTNIFHPTPLDTINESNVVQVATAFTNKFKTILQKVPVIENPMRVFRAVDPDDEIKVFPLRGLSSTTYDPFSSTFDTFANIQTKCCVMDIVLQPGVRALWIEPISQFEDEREILIDSTFVDTKIDETPTLAQIMSVNELNGTQSPGREPVELNIFRCEVTPSQPGQPPKNIVGKIIRFITGRRGGMYWPLKYYRGLTRKQNLQRKRSATRRTKMSFTDPKAYVPFKSDKGVKTRRSSYTSKFHSKYPDAKTLPDIAKATGISKSILQEVYDRGMAAWRTGHRPGASQHAWGMARVHSFVLKGKTWRTADSDLARKV